ncbi:rCG50375 [Rattus norvegicus]|uniref:RCG50375 n=1 Tax=Rattus norvegicus TaxID=10116 RepID=A6JZ49_RAT|nr:rCG50375 [Rattus norvegicus]
MSLALRIKIHPDSQGAHSLVG